MAQLNVQALRQEFPILHQKVQGEKLIYFDNAATSQTPQSVLDRIVYYYQHERANAHRAVHSLGALTTEAFETSRQKIADFIGARSADEISFTSGDTESLNRVIRGLIEPRLQAGDLILTTRLEHHSSLVPLQEVCHRSGAKLVFLDLDENFQVTKESLAPYDQNPKVKALVTQHISNVLGVEQNIPYLSQWALRQSNCLFLVDGAQAVAHQKLDLAKWQVATYTFSSHKMYGPMGLGVTYIRQDLLEQAQPVCFGGEMIYQVKDDISSFKKAPWKFEAGTQAIAQIIGLAEAIDWIQAIGIKNLHQQEAELGQRLYHGLTQVEGLEIYTPQSFAKNGIIAFNIQAIHPHDAATAYDQAGIALRAGHHCAQPLMRLLKIPASLRASLMAYNTKEEVDRMIEVSHKVKEFFNYGA